MDSSSRDGNGESSSDGTAIILHFLTLLDLAFYIKHVYLDLPGKKLVQYEIYYVKMTLNISEKVRRNTVSSHKSEKQRGKRKLQWRTNKRKQKTAKKTLENATTECSLPFSIPSAVDSEHVINKFKTKVAERPVYICCICNRCLYRKSVIIYDNKKYRT